MEEKLIRHPKDSWNNITEWVASSRLRTISTTFLLLFIGMVASAIVNYISSDPYFAKWFFLGGFGALTILVLGIMLGRPFFTFRFKYDFLSDYEDQLALQLFYFDKRADSLLHVEDGILAIQLFKVEKHTYDEYVEYNFHKKIDKKASRSKISKISPNKLKIPIDFFRWFYEFNKKGTPPFHLRLNKFVTQMVFDFIRNKYEKDILQSTQIEADEDRFKDALEKWGATIREDTIYKSIHYITLFDVIDKILISDMDSSFIIEGYKMNNLIPPHKIYKMSYNDTKKTKKKNRMYFAINISYDLPNEGKHEFIVLLIADKRMIPDTNTASPIFQYLFQEGLIKKGENQHA